jgi:cyclopropane-fatty-acyl-phospholipid synthase
MGIATTLLRRTGHMADRAVRAGLARLADSIAAAGGAPMELVLPDGSRIGFGLPARIRLEVRDTSVLPALAEPTFSSLADAFVQGRIDFEGDPLEVLPWIDRLVGAAGSSPMQRIASAWSRHTPSQDKQAIGYHYDVGNDFYRLWLDRRMVYSCAYFHQGDETLDEAQRAKLDHICRKLRLTPGERLLDIGCGWGGLVIHAAQHYGVSAVGITLSEQQHAWANDQLREFGLTDRVEVLLLDYRELRARYGAGYFDKVASVGMFEHVGLRNLPEYFGAISAVLKERGLVMNHGITSADVNNRPVGGGAGDFIGKYVFPHGELPHLALVVQQMSAAGLEVADIESLRAHYAKTLEHWSRRLEARLDDAARVVSERTLRIWRAYLAGCSYGFRQGWVSIYQVLASRQREPGPTALPLTRDWIYR